MKTFEPFLYIVVFVVLGAGLISEGARAAALERKVPVTAKELYRQLARGQTKVQIIDIREDVEENFEDTHIPGSIPFPECDRAQTPEAARDMIEASVPTVIVSEDGDAEAFAACAKHFTSARNLAGGIEGWSDEGLPEETDEYEPPAVGAGGGCL